ncbi:hypothetical protein NB16F76_21650 [Escherichia coli]
MKQMTLIEMDGFLKGKCIPRDLKVNETNAEYLVRKFGELESKLETALRECRSAGITIDNLEAKCAALAAENAAMKADHVRIFNSGYQRGHEATVEGYFVDIHQNDITTYHEDIVAEIEEEETQATDSFLAEVRAQGVELAISQAFRDVIPVNRMQFISRMTAFADQLRKGGNQ